MAIKGRYIKEEVLSSEVKYVRRDHIIFFSRDVKEGNRWDKKHRVWVHWIGLYNKSETSYFLRSNLGAWWLIFRLKYL